MIEKVKSDGNKTKYMINDRFDFFKKSIPQSKKHISKIKKINTPGKNIKQKNKFSLNKANNPPAVNPVNMEFLDFSNVEKIQEQLDKWISELNKIKNEKEIKLEEMMNDFSKIDKLIGRHSNDSSNLIQILLDVQGEYKWLPKHALLYVGNKLDVPLTRIYGIASFYKFFNLTPKGKYEIIVCAGTACHVRGSMNLLQRIINILKIKPGDTTPDYRFTLDTVNCLGCCALGPVMYFNKKYYSDPSTKELKKLFKVPEVN
jgi:NADH-quinone oxidoreductase subunit E